MIPHGLMAAWIKTNHGRTEVRILQLSKLGFTFRLANAEYPVSDEVSIAVHMPEGNEDLYVDLCDVRIEKEEAAEYWNEYRLETDDPKFAAAAGNFMRRYSSYISMKQEYDETERMHSLRSDVYCASIEEQRLLWSKMYSLPARIGEAEEFCVVLGDRELMREYLESDDDVFFRSYFSTRCVPEHVADALHINCIYVGSEYCEKLMPDIETAVAVFEKAVRGGIHPVLCLPPVCESAVDRACGLSEALAARFGTIEVVVNDWGMLSYMAARGRNVFLPIPGILICKSRKDPRADAAGIAHLLPFGSSVDALFFKKWLHDRFGVAKLSYDRSDYTEHSDIGASLYWPMQQLNTSGICTLRTACVHGDRSAQAHFEKCDEYCRNNYFFYPQNLNIVGKYNTLFGLSEKICDRHFERIVIDLL